MKGEVTHKTVDQLLAKISELESKLLEANGIIEAIREGSVDALVLNKDGKPSIYSIESADYTYRLLIEKFDEGALSISEEGWVLYCNEYFSNLVGIPTNKIIGTFFNSYVDSVGLFQQLKMDLKNGPSKGEIVLNIGGKKLPVCASLTDLNPSVPAIGIIITDLSERRRHEEALSIYQRKLELKISELNQMNMNLGQFIHVISHDIKEPLRKIVAYSSHLSSTAADVLPPDKLNSLGVIGSSASRLNSLVDDLVKYAFSTNKDEAAEVDLNLVIRDVMDDLELLVAENSATVRPRPLPKIMGSAIQMRQLFSNLITNAIKFRKAEASPVITIETDITDCIDKHDPNKKFHRISLHDNGIGMDKARLTKIFMIFRRLHMPEEYPGNGIGLAICKKIMENHQGNIEAESSPNIGSTFHLYFPVNT
jgi:signal transduction histidine kinase